ncbi:MAG: hypothetical protein LH605_06840 [Microbacteriaceae bacterium]|nr:hypothetical protein [Microbacteriaceae bacterium]
MADHTHVKKIGNGSCVVIVEGSGEGSVELPAAVFDNNPNVDVGQVAGRRSPAEAVGQSHATSPDLLGWTVREPVSTLDGGFTR